MEGLRIFRSERWYVAEMPALHVVTRARTMPALRKNLKEAIEVATDGLLALKSAKIKGTEVVVARL